MQRSSFSSRSSSCTNIELFKEFATTFAPLASAFISQHHAGATGIGKCPLMMVLILEALLFLVHPAGQQPEPDSGQLTSGSGLRVRIWRTTIAPGLGTLSSKSFICWFNKDWPFGIDRGPGRTGRRTFLRQTPNVQLGTARANEPPWNSGGPSV